ncbi:MAG: hypothetical protein Q9198_004588 [Flavoplaca austrocitrina]
MSQSQLLVKVTQANPVDGKETYIISTQTFKYQLCIPNDNNENSLEAYFALIDDTRERIGDGRAKLLRLIDSLPASDDEYVVEDLRLKLQGQAAELEQLAFYFHMIRGVLFDWDDVFMFLKGTARRCSENCATPGLSEETE